MLHLVTFCQENEMRKHANDCGVRNHFGYYDAHAREIVLKHPCLKKADVDVVYCKKCLKKKLNIKESDWKFNINKFKEQGCNLF